MKKVTLISVLMAFVLSSCLSAQKESEPIESLTNFQSISLGTSADVYISKGDYKVEMEGPKNFTSKMVFRVDGGNLKIERQRNLMDWNGGRVKVYVTMPAIESIAIGGSGNVELQEPFEGLGQLEIAIGGAGDTKLMGSSESLSISIAGSGNVDASSLNTASCEVSIAGSGDAKVGEVEKLEVSIAGSGDVHYRGNPSIEKSIVGSGDVIPQ